MRFPFDHGTVGEIFFSESLMSPGMCESFHTIKHSRFHRDQSRRIGCDKITGHKFFQESAFLIGDFSRENEFVPLWRKRIGFNIHKNIDLVLKRSNQLPA